MAAVQAVKKGREEEWNDGRVEDWENGRLDNSTIRQLQEWNIGILEY